MVASVAKKKKDRRRGGECEREKISKEKDFSYPNVFQWFQRIRNLGLHFQLPYTRWTSRRSSFLIYHLNHNLVQVYFRIINLEKAKRQTDESSIEVDSKIIEKITNPNFFNKTVDFFFSIVVLIASESWPWKFKEGYDSFIYGGRLEFIKLKIKFQKVISTFRNFVSLPDVLSRCPLQNRENEKTVGTIAILYWSRKNFSSKNKTR